MAVFKCKMCGGALDVAEKQGVITCDYCGTQQTLPKSDDEVTRNLFNRANSLRLKNEFDKAQELYEKIISTGSTDAEAYWGNVLCKFGIEYVEDPATFKRIPTCHRTQLEPVASDVDYKAAIENADDSQKAIYEAEAKAIDELQKNILHIIEGEEPFDVFICYKETDEDGKRTPDSVIANDIYHQLTQEGFKVFYSAITLEDKLGQEYEPYIFSALNSAQVMLVVGTKPEYFNAVWVRNEWSRFLKIVKNDRKKALIPCYKDMDAYDLPEEFSHLQAQDMSKIGFINDVVRGIKKLISPDAPATPSTPAAPGASKVPPVNGANAETLVDKAMLLIEDGNGVKAKELLNQALNIQPKNGEAYLGLLLIEMGVKEVSALGKCTKSLRDSQNFQRAVRFCSDDLKEKLEGYDKAIQESITEKKYNDAAKIIKNNLENAGSTSNVDSRISAIKSAESTLKSLGDYKDSAELASKCPDLLKPLLDTQNVQKKKRNKIIAICVAIATVVVAVFVVVSTVIIPASKYKDALKLSEEGKYLEAIAAFEELDDYKDSKNQAIKNIYIIAEGYYKDKDYSSASSYYESCGDYEDSAEKIKECKYQIARNLIKEKNQDDANILLEEIKGYKDSEKLIHYHDYKVSTKKATCTKDGSKTYKCKGCSHSYKEKLPATGHNFSAATCTKASKCSRCGAKGDAALGHTAGTICSRCGKSTFETLHFSGKGTKMIRNINLPEGAYLITCSFVNHSDGVSNAAAWFYHGDSYDLILNGSGDNGTESKFFNGSVVNGYIQMETKLPDCTWKITIEAQ